MVNLNCQASVAEQMHDFAQSKRDNDADETLEDAKENGDLALAVKRILRKRIDLTFIQENIDFYSGITLSAMGFPTTMFTVLFGLARTVGWLAHWKEMMLDKSTRIGRPRQL